ncbi:zinc finger BED domain-containing protein 4-like [Ixodes scapularis]
MNRKSFVNHLDILYREQKASLIATLEKATRVCCTADCWTASNRVFGEATEPEEDVIQNCITETMYGVAKALDILQGEQYMYMGVLQPTLHSLLRYQGSLSQMQYCTPLSNALEAGVKKRFSEVLEDKDLALAAAVHPKFKLSWIMENERKAATVRLLEEECRALEEHCSEDATGKEDGDEDDFFFHLPQALPSSTEVQQWVSDPATDLTGLSRFPMIKRIFIRLNTGIPSSAPAERLFSKGRDVFAIKRGKLSDDNFEKQLILSYNKYCK